MVGMGKAADWVRKQAEKHMRRQLQGYISASENDAPDTLAKQSADGTKAVLPTGEVVNLIKQGSPKSIDAAIRISDDTVYMPDPYVPEWHIEGAKKPWMMIGGYSSSSLNSDSSTPPTSFPEFNLYDLTSLQKYRIPKESLPILYDSATEVAFRGCWWGKFNSNHIVLVRIGKKVDNSGINTEDHIHVFSAVISDYALDSDNNKVDLTGATVVQKHDQYDFLEVGSFTPYTSIPLFPGEEVYIDGIGNSWDFAYWEQNVSTGTDIGTMRVMPAISLVSNPIVDIIGGWFGQTIGQAVYNRGISYTYQQIRTVEDGGVFTVLDFHGGATLASTDYGRTGLSDHVTFRPTSQQNRGIIPQTNVLTTINATFASAINLSTAVTTNTANAAFKNQEVDPLVNNSAENRALFMKPYRNTTLTYDINEPFILDDTRLYPSFDSITSWNTNSAKVKALGGKKFLELFSHSVGVSTRQWWLRNWRYDADLNTMIAGTDVKSATLPTNMQVIAQASTFSNGAVVDFTTL